MGSITKDITIDLMVDENIGKVLFAEVDADFLDILLSFFTIRLGTVHVVHDMQSNIGCIGRLYQSVFDLLKQRSGENLDRLRFPNRSKNFEDCSKTGITKYYCVCRNYTPSISLSFYPRCKCGILYYKENKDGEELLFLKEGGKFVITDEFIGKPITLESSTYSLLSSIGIPLVNNCKLKRVTITGDNQVLDLFKRSLVSTTPLSDVFLPEVTKKDDTVLFKGNLIKSRDVFLKVPKENDKPEKVNLIKSSSSTTQKCITVKLLVDKLKNRVLFAEAKDDFIDLLSSFFHISLEEITRELLGRNAFPCLSNLHQSASDLEVDKFKSEKHKSAFNPNSPPFFTSFLETITDGLCCSIGNEKGLFIVSDDLHVTPYSVVSSIPMLQKSNMSMKDIEEREVSVGEEEAKKLLMASLTSNMALTRALLM